MQRISEYLEVTAEGDKKVIRCKCGHTVCPVTDNYKKYVLMSESSPNKAGPHVNPFNLGRHNFVSREFYCPNCLTLLDTEVALKGDPLLWDVQLRI